MKPPFEPVRAAYIRCLQAARPALDEQLADVRRMLDALLDGAESGGPSALDQARADYVLHLRTSRTTFDQQIAELAALCTYLFIPELWAV